MYKKYKKCRFMNPARRRWVKRFFTLIDFLIKTNLDLMDLFFMDLYFAI